MSQKSPRLPVIKEMLSDKAFKITLLKKFYGDEDEQAGALAASPDDHLQKRLNEISDDDFDELQQLFKNDISSHNSRSVAEEDDDADVDVHLPEHSKKISHENGSVDQGEIEIVQDPELEQNNNVPVPDCPDEVVCEMNTVNGDRSLMFPANSPDITDPTNGDQESLPESGQPSSISSDSHESIHAQETSDYGSIHVVGQRRCQENQCLPEIRCKICQHPITLQLINDVYRQNAELNELKEQISQANVQIAELHQMLEVKQHECDNANGILQHFLEELGVRKRKIDELERELLRLENKSREDCALAEKSFEQNVQLVEENYKCQEKLLRMENDAFKQKTAYSAELLFIEKRVNEEIDKLKEAYLQMQRFSLSCKRNLSQTVRINPHV